MVIINLVESDSCAAMSNLCIKKFDKILLKKYTCRIFTNFTNSFTGMVIIKPVESNSYAAAMSNLCIKEFVNILFEEVHNIFTRVLPVW